MSRHSAWRAARASRAARRPSSPSTLSRATVASERRRGRPLLRRPDEERHGRRRDVAAPRQVRDDGRDERRVAIGPRDDRRLVDLDLVPVQLAEDRGEVVAARLVERRLQRGLDLRRGLPRLGLIVGAGRVGPRAPAIAAPEALAVVEPGEGRDQAEPAVGVGLRVEATDQAVDDRGLVDRLEGAERAERRAAGGWPGGSSTTSRQASDALRAARALTAVWATIGSGSARSGAGAAMLGARPGGRGSRGLAADAGVGVLGRRRTSPEVLDGPEADSADRSDGELRWRAIRREIPSSCPAIGQGSEGALADRGSPARAAKTGEARRLRGRVPA